MSSLSFGVWVGIIPCLHPACITYRPFSLTPSLIYHHPFYSSLPHRLDMDPTSSWVLALLCASTGPILPHRSLPTLLPSIYPHSTRPHFGPLPPQLCLISPQPPQNHSTPLMSMALWACTDASFLSRPKSGSVAGCSVGLEAPPPYLLNPPHPRKSQTKLERQTVPCPCLPPVTIPPLLSHTTSTPCHPQRPSPCLLPAHTRGGSVCGRGGVHCRFWRGTSVG
jgi:hypothetical protein